MTLLTKKFIFVRHGNTDWTMDQVYLGPKDYGLNSAGKKEAEIAAINIREYFKNVNAQTAIIISSELNRAKETAEIISKINGNIPVLYDINLNERHYGDLVNSELVNAEEEEKFNERISTTILNILAHKYQNLIIVSHCGVFKSLQKTLLNNRPKYINTGEGMLFIYDDLQWKIEKF